METGTNEVLSFMTAMIAPGVDAHVQRERSLSILRAITDEEGAALEDGRLPTTERLLEIARSTGTSSDAVMQVCHAYQRIRSQTSPHPRPKASRAFLESVRGKYAHIPGSSDQYLAEKHREAEHER